MKVSIPTDMRLSNIDMSAWPFVSLGILIVALLVLMDVAILALSLVNLVPDLIML